MNRATIDKRFVLAFRSDGMDVPIRWSMASAVARFLCRDVPGAHQDLS